MHGPDKPDPPTRGATLHQIRDHRRYGARVTSTPQIPQECSMVETAYTIHLAAAGRAHRTVKLYVYWLSRVAETVPLHQATTADLEAFLARPYAPETRKAIRVALRSYYRWAHRRGILPVDPAHELAPIRIPRSVPNVADDADVLRALDGATPEVRALVMLTRLACLRISEATTLRAESVAGDWLTIRGKGDRERRVYLRPELRDALAVLPRAGYVFPGRYGGHVHVATAARWIKDATGWNPHALRHAGATAAYRATGDLRAVQAMLGHSSMATTQRYLHMDEDALRAASLGTALRAA